MYHIAVDQNEQTPLTIPAVLGDAHYHAYQALIAKDIELSPALDIGDTLYLHLNETSGPASVPQNLNLAPSAIVVDGVAATFIDRVDQTDSTQRYWVKCTVPDTISAPYSTATVTFSNVANGNSTRVYTVADTEIFVAP
jgi:hypothetical protein